MPSRRGTTPTVTRLARARCAKNAEPYLEIIIPTLNEEKRISSTVHKIVTYLQQQPYGGSIAVVDNGSIDRTSEVVASLAHEMPIPIRLIGCADRGKGAAVRRGMLSSAAHLVGFSDADLSTPIETLEKGVPLLEDGADVVIASRRCPGARYMVEQPLQRRLATRVFRSIARACVSEIGVLADTQCGFKFFHKPVAQALFGPSRSNGFAFDIEILALAQAAGYRVAELPVNWQDAEGSTVSMTEHAGEIVTELFTIRTRLAQQTATGTAVAV